MTGEVLFDGSEDVSEWESVDDGADTSEQDYNEYDIEFINMEDVEEGQYWVGEYTGTRTLGDAQSPSSLFDNDEKEVTYGFPYHAMLKSQLADTELSENQIRADDPVEKGESVAVVYQGTKAVEGRPMDMHVWDVRRPPQ